VTATRSDDGRTLVLKAVNIGRVPIRAAVSIVGLKGIDRNAQIWTLTGDLKAINSAEHPEAVRWKLTHFDGASERFEYTFPAYSYSVVRMRGSR